MINLLKIHYRLEKILIKVIIIVTLPINLSMASQTMESAPKYTNVQLPINERVQDLLSRMTLEEKIAQLQCTSTNVAPEHLIPTTGIGGVGSALELLTAGDAAEKANAIQKVTAEKTRLGIPVIIHAEALHGLVAKKATSFPQAIGLASSWDPSLIEKVAAAIGKETASRGIRQVLAPVVNIARDVRWGRVEETYGEDPHLTVQMAIAFCRGLQGEGVIATPKHFAANVGDGGRDSFPTHFSERILREIYFPAFKACIQAGHAGSVMAAYNSLDGLPCSSNPWLLTDVLRKEWGFTGFVVSDYGSLAGIRNRHLAATTEKEAAAAAINAGLDMELPVISYYSSPLHEAVSDGLVSESTINESVKRILEAKFRIGLFDNRYVEPKAAAIINDSPQHRHLALEAARKAIVLLKNENHTLPLSRKTKSIAVVGPKADIAMLGGYSGFDIKTVTILDAIRKKISPTAEVFFAKGIDNASSGLPKIPKSILIPINANKGEHGLKGEYFNNINLSGTPAFVRTDTEIDFDWGAKPPSHHLQSNRYSVRWSGIIVPVRSGIYKIGVTANDGVRLYINDKLVINAWYMRAVTSDTVSIRLEAGKRYKIRMEYYNNEGVASVHLGWMHTGDIAKNLLNVVKIAEKADVIIVAVGIKEGEGHDRISLDLPEEEENLIDAVTQTGKPTIVILQAGSAVTMSSWFNRVQAIVNAWYAGEEGGSAIADVLFGDYNPGGKLPITFPKFVGQAPLYYNYEPSGRGDDYVKKYGSPLFPFGYGLSFTVFEYSDLKVNPQRITPTTTVKVSVDVKNTGSRTGDEVIQLYIHNMTSGITRPLKELKGFQRITLQPGENKTVVFQLTPEHLSILDRTMKYVVAPGRIEILIGSSSDDIRAKSSTEIVQY